MLRALTPDKSTHTCEYDFWDSQPRPRARTFSPGRARAARRLHPRQRHAERAPHAGAVPALPPTSCTAPAGVLAPSGQVKKLRPRDMKRLAEINSKDVLEPGFSQHV